MSVCEQIGTVTVIKSGSDFTEFSAITVDFETKQVQRERVLVTENYKPDPTMV